MLEHSVAIGSMDLGSKVRTVLTALARRKAFPVPPCGNQEIKGVGMEVEGQQWWIPETAFTEATHFLFQSAYLQLSFLPHSELGSISWFFPYIICFYWSFGN